MIKVGIKNKTVTPRGLQRGCKYSFARSIPGSGTPLYCGGQRRGVLFNFSCTTSCFDKPHLHLVIQFFYRCQNKQYFIKCIFLSPPQRKQVELGVGQVFPVPQCLNTKVYYFLSLQYYRKQSVSQIIALENFMRHSAINHNLKEWKSN